MNVKEILHSHEVFSQLPQSMLDTLATCDVQKLASGTILVGENRIEENYFYLLLEGRIDVVASHMLLDQLFPGAIIGRTPNLRRERVPKIYQATIKSVVLIIPNHVIDSLATQYPQISFKLFEKLQDQSFSLLKSVNQKALDLVEEKKNMGFFIVNLTVILSAFAAVVNYLQKTTHLHEMPFTTTALLFLGATFLIFRLIKTKTPLSIIGLSTRNLRETIWQALWLSAIVILVMSILFFFIHTFNPNVIIRLKEKYLIHHSALFLVLTYPLNVIFQDILIRGGVQGLFVQFLDFEHRHAFAIVLASLVYASTHAAYGFLTVLTLFIPGLLWGWMYYRQGNIIGVILSHIVVGLTFIALVSHT